jgi:hypothetical protein
MRDGGGSAGGSREGAEGDAQLSKLRQALEKITTSPSGAGEEGGQLEWHER